MKLLIGFMIATFLGTAGAVFAEEVNFKAVNPVLQALVDATIAADEYVDYAYPRFDEKASDFTAEKLKYDLQGSVKNTPWLLGGHADVTATSTYAADRTPGKEGLRITLASTVRTDVLALIRYSAYLAQKKSGNYDPKFKVRMEEHLKRMAVVQSFDEVYPLLLSGQILSHDMMNETIAKEQEYLKCLETDACVGYPSKQEAIARTRQYITDFGLSIPANDQIEIKTKTDAAGKITELSLRSPDPSLFFADSHTKLFQPSALQATITAETITAMSEGIAPLQVASLDKLKADYKNTLSGAQNGIAGDKDRIQSEFRSVLILFKKTITGESK